MASRASAFICYCVAIITRISAAEQTAELELECGECQTLTNTSCCLPGVLCPTFRVCVVVREPIIALALQNPHLAEEEEGQQTLSGFQSPAETVTAL